MSEKIVQLNEEVIKGQIKELLRGSVEETLNDLLEAEAQKPRYERREERQAYRSGHYQRNLTATSGDVTLNVSRLKGMTFETAIIERYRRRESSVEEALIEMHLAGVSVRHVEDITEALWGSKVSPSTILTIQQLSESGRYHRQFALLQKLGMDRREMARPLGRQFAIFYTMPAIPPLFIGIPFVVGLFSLLHPGVLPGPGQIFAIVGVALGLFLLIYLIYILMAYTAMKRNVLPDP